MQRTRWRLRCARRSDNIAGGNATGVERSLGLCGHNAHVKYPLVIVGIGIYLCDHKDTRANAGHYNDMPIWRFERGVFLNYLKDLPVRGMFGLFALLPYAQSLRFASWFARKALARSFGINRRISKNLKLVWPDLPEEDIRRLSAEVIDNSARVMVESFRPVPFNRRAENAEFVGEGKAELLKRLANNQPVVLVSGHFGNYQVPRVLLRGLGHETAGIYRPMNNAFTNKRYISNMDRIAGPNFSRGRLGTKGLLGHLRKGGAIALLNDQSAIGGTELRFMGHPAWTMTSAAEIALKYKAKVFPYYAIRLPSGLDFKVVVEKPITEDTPEQMTQTLNNSLESMVRRYPGQWFWIHRRWKIP